MRVSPLLFGAAVVSTALVCSESSAGEQSPLDRARGIMERCRVLLSEEQIAEFEQARPDRQIAFVWEHCENAEIEALPEDGAPAGYVPPTGYEWAEYEACRDQLPDHWREKFFHTPHANRLGWLKLHCSVPASVFAKCEPYLTEEEIRDFWKMFREEYQVKWLKAYCNKEALAQRKEQQKSEKSEVEERRPPTVLLFPLRAPDQAAIGDVAFLDEVVAGELGEVPSERIEIERATGAFEGECDDACFASRARDAGAKYALHGRITPLGDGYGGSLRLVRVDDPPQLVTHASLAEGGELTALVAPMTAAAGEVREALLAEVSAPAKKAETEPAAAAAPAPQPPSTMYAGAYEGSAFFDRERNLTKYRRLVGGGMGLLVAGTVVGVIAGVLIAVGSDTGRIVGYVLAPGELAFVIPGIALVVVGAKGMGRAEKGMPVSFDLRLQLAGTPLRLTF